MNIDGMLKSKSEKQIGGKYRNYKLKLMANSINKKF